MSADMEIKGSSLAADEARRTLPDYDNPPVVETLLSVSFSDLEKWGIPHFGLYWERIRAEYPKFELRPPVVSQIETFSDGEERGPAVLEFELLNQPPIRCWFIHENENRLIQLQNNRFIFNWRKVREAERYPRFDDAIRENFEQEWIRFTEFLGSESIPLARIEQCEISYINHIPIEGGWRTYTALVEALTTWPGVARATQFLPVPEDIQFNTRYPMQPGNGRLHIQLQQGTRNLDGKRVAQLILTARGRPESSETAELLNWFDLGREWIVRGFTDFTSEAMHKIWQRRK